MSVSYTHLDVYKRQLWALERFAANVWLQILCVVSSMSVSYTHLIHFSSTRASHPPATLCPLTLKLLLLIYADTDKIV